MSAAATTASMISFPSLVSSYQSSFSLVLFSLICLSLTSALDLGTSTPPVGKVYLSLCVFSDRVACPVPVFFLRRHTLGASANQHAVLTTPLPTHFSTDSLSTSVVWGSPRAPCSLCWIPSVMIFWSSLQLLHYSVILWTSLSGLVYCIWVCQFFENELPINCSTWLENDQIIIEKE